LALQEDLERRLGGLPNPARTNSEGFEHMNSPPPKQPHSTPEREHIDLGLQNSGESGKHPEPVEPAGPA
jgi:hypothetical protein